MQFLTYICVLGCNYFTWTNDQHMIKNMCYLFSECSYDIQHQSCPGRLTGAMIKPGQTLWNVIGGPPILTPAEPPLPILPTWFSPLHSAKKYPVCCFPAQGLKLQKPSLLTRGGRGSAGVKMDSTVLVTYKLAISKCLRSWKWCCSPFEKLFSVIF